VTPHILVEIAPFQTNKVTRSSENNAGVNTEEHEEKACLFEIREMVG